MEVTSIFFSFIPLVPNKSLSELKEKKRLRAEGKEGTPAVGGPLQPSRSGEQELKK